MLDFSLLTDDQERAFQEINDQWPVATGGVDSDDVLHLVLDDGDKVEVQTDGAWEFIR